MFTSLVLTDFSGSAQNAADFYLQNLPTDANRIMLYHNIDYPVGQVDSSVSLEVLTERILEDLNAEKKRLAQKNSKVQIDSTYTVGKISTTVQDVIKDFKIDLLIMGAPHEKNFVELLSGTDFSKNVLKSDCPLLVCPPQAEAKTIEEITLVYFARQEVETNRFEILKQLLKNKKCSIDILLIQDNDEDKNSRAEEFLKSQFREDELSITLVEHENEVDEIKYFAEQLNADLVALLPEEKDFFERIFASSTEEHLIKHLNQPLLIYKKANHETEQI